MHDQLLSVSPIPLSEADRILATSFPSIMQRVTTPVVAEPILCYADGNWLYFTTLSLDEQTGPGWRLSYVTDAWCPPEEDEHITRIAYHADLIIPIDEFDTCSYYNVYDLNKEKHLPWLLSSLTANHYVKIWAGMTLAEVIDVIHGIEGHVYLQLKKEEKPYGSR